MTGPMPWLRPTDPRFALFADLASDTNRLFIIYTHAGFTNEQALYLVGQLLTSGVVDAQDEDQQVDPA